MDSATIATETTTSTLPTDTITTTVATEAITVTVPLASSSVLKRQVQGPRRNQNPRPNNPAPATTTTSSRPHAITQAPTTKPGQGVVFNRFLSSAGGFVASVCTCIIVPVTSRVTTTPISTSSVTATSTLSVTATSTM